MIFLTDTNKPDWAFKYLDIVKNTDTDHRDEEYGLVFRAKDGTIRTAWIMRDPEGNGAGHLDITANRNHT